MGILNIIFTKKESVPVERKRIDTVDDILGTIQSTEDPIVYFNFLDTIQKFREKIPEFEEVYPGSPSLEELKNFDEEQSTHDFIRRYGMNFYNELKKLDSMPAMVFCIDIAKKELLEYSDRMSEDNLRLVRQLF